MAGSYPPLHQWGMHSAVSGYCNHVLNHIVSVQTFMVPVGSPAPSCWCQIQMEHTPGQIKAAPRSAGVEEGREWVEWGRGRVEMRVEWEQWQQCMLYPIPSSQARFTDTRQHDLHWLFCPVVATGAYPRARE